MILKKIVRNTFPRTYRLLYRFRRNPKDINALLSFLFKPDSVIKFKDRLTIVMGVCKVSSIVPCAHTEEEILRVIKGIFYSSKDNDGCIVEAGCFKGGSTAKLSIAAGIVNRPLIVFDSFRGIPENDELNPDGSYHHAPGLWQGSLEEVTTNVTKYGRMESCQFVEGLFEDTMPQFSSPIVTAFIDVDLASSTRTCLKHLYPLIVKNGALLSQDGHLRQVIEVFEDEKFWLTEVGSQKPFIDRIRHNKLVRIKKEV